MGKNQRLRFILWSLTSSFCILFSIAIPFLFPFEWHQVKTQFHLLTKSVRQQRVGNFQSYHYQSCTSSSQTRPIPVYSSSSCLCAVFLHSEGDDATTWQNIFFWPEDKWKQMGLTRARNFLAIHLPGTGGTPLEFNKAQSRKIAQALKTELPAFCSHWVAIGNGFGGAVASWLSLLWPEGIDRLILIGSTGLQIQRLTPSFFQTPISASGLQDFYTKAYFHPPRLSDTLLKSMVARTQKSQIRTLLELQTPADDLDLFWPSLTIPTLILWGKEDRITPLTLGRHIRTLIPNATWREVQACGHFPQKECPLAVIQSIIDMTNMGAM